MDKYKPEVSNTPIEFPFSSKNMHYMFYKEYFADICQNGDAFDFEENNVESKNRQIVNFTFKDNLGLEWNEIPGFKSFTLYTAYPGLLIGLGYNHNTGINGAFKGGFTFDQVTGVPFLPGSSLKGVLKSYFPNKKSDGYKGKKEYLKKLLNKENVDDSLIEALIENIFTNNDCFLGAVPENSNGQKLLAEEFITPHSDIYKNPNPISLVKIKPNVLFRFCFVLRDFCKDGIVITAEEKKNLFMNIILDMGVGAKTNVGFGNFQKKPGLEPQMAYTSSRSACSQPNNYQKSPKKQNPKQETPVDTSGERGICKTPGCGKKVSWNQNTKKWGNFCDDCLAKKNKNKDKK